MVQASESESRKLLVALRDAMAEDSAGQARLNKIVKLTARSMGSEVCSIYLFRDTDTRALRDRRAKRDCRSSNSIAKR